MAKRTGGNIAFLIATVAVAALRGWSVEDIDVDVDVTAAGDSVMDRESLRGDYTVEGNSLLEVASPYVLPANVRGQKVAWSAEVLASDANGIVSSTGKVGRFRIEGSYDNAIQVSWTINAAGTPLTYDTSPLS
jgi:hypothetical protein